MAISSSHRASTGWRRATSMLGLALVGAALAGCGGDDSGSSGDAGPVTVTVLTHDSFALTESLLTAFESESGINVELVMGGDAGEVVNRAVLSAGNPEGDVLFGVDNTLLSRALAADVFAAYEPDLLSELQPELRDLGEGVVVPVDYGDVCVNLDDAWFAEHGVTPPRTLEELTDPTYKDLLVVENPATSSPGLAFLLATIARFGDGWTDYWSDLTANGVKVVNGWTEAYTGEFSGGSDTGTRPLVVSYASSPPAEIVFAADPKPERPSTSVMADGCFRQVEFAGVLNGTEHEAEARQVVDWLLSEQVQADVPLSMFVFPARTGVPLPAVFEQWAAQPTDPLSLPADEIDDEREAWLDEWTSIVLR
jgi:thiamine transport system substrate-binding protein